MSILDQIVETKRHEVAAAKAAAPLEKLKETIASLPRPRNFFQAVTSRGKKPLNLIAEIKKASPSAGLIQPNFDPVETAKLFASAGADALSVLTDEKYFQGSLDYLQPGARRCPAAGFTQGFPDRSLPGLPIAAPPVRTRFCSSPNAWKRRS